MKNRKAFTLIELTIVIAIISVLAAVTMKGYGWINSSKVSAVGDQVRTIRTAMMNLKAVNGGTTYVGYLTAGSEMADLANKYKLITPADVDNKVSNSPYVLSAISATGFTLSTDVGDSTMATTAINNINAIVGTGTCVIDTPNTKFKCVFSGI